MFEQDYIMRMIKELVRAILKLVFNIDTSAPFMDILKNEEEKNALQQLYNLIDEGHICDAENKLFYMLSDSNMGNFKLALLFYSYLNDKDENFLTEHNFSREEIQLGIKDLISKYGISGLDDFFLN